MAAPEELLMKAYDEGYASYFAGDLLGENNPYEMGSAEADEWEAGSEDAGLNDFIFNG
jgi:hypothetical protein